LNQPGSRLRHTDENAELPRRDRSSGSFLGEDNDTIEEDGSDAAVESSSGMSQESSGASSQPEPVAEEHDPQSGSDDQTEPVEGADPKVSKLQDYGTYTIEMLTGRYSYPATGCVIFSYSHMHNSMTITESRRVCLTTKAAEVPGGGKSDQAAHVEKSILVKSGMVVTNDGQLSSLQYITTGAHTWLFASLNADEASEIAVKPKTTTSLSKIGITGRILDFTLSTGQIMMAEVTGKMDKSALNRNCFVVYGKNPWDEDKTKGKLGIANYSFSAVS